MRLSSSSFEPGEAIPKRYTGEGENKSPGLEWTDVPKETQQLALLVEDPDAPRAEAVVHWLMYKIPGSVSKLVEGIPNGEVTQLPQGAFQGLNSHGELGYFGPMPPVGHGRHRYFFRLYALDREISLEAGATRAKFLNAIETHVLAHAELMGTYERPAARDAARRGLDKEKDAVRRSA